MIADDYVAQGPNPSLDFAEPYEERVVSFSDVLGWRAHINDTLANPERLRWLRVIVEGWSAQSRLDYSVGHGGLRITTFSDNVVLSHDIDEAGTLVARLALMQLVAAGAGFWIRGGITAGKIIHKQTCVFGPALNRAYELESKIAIYPRIVVDECLLGKLGVYGSVVANENGLHFIDPFTPQFFRSVEKNAVEPQKPFGSKRAARSIATYLQKEMGKGLGEKEAKKILWLYFRLARNFDNSEFAQYFPLPPGISDQSWKQADV